MSCITTSLGQPASVPFQGCRLRPLRLRVRAARARAASPCPQRPDLPISGPGSVQYLRKETKRKKSFNIFSSLQMARLGQVDFLLLISKAMLICKHEHNSCLFL